MCIATSWHGNAFRITDNLWGDQLLVDSLDKGPVCGVLKFFVANWIGCWTTSGVVGDLRHHQARDVTLVTIHNILPGSRQTTTVWFRLHIGYGLWTIYVALICPPEFQNNTDKYSLLMHCIKIKSPAKSLLNEQYVFVGGNIYFLCVLSCSSEEA